MKHVQWRKDGQFRCSTQLANIFAPFQCDYKVNTYQKWHKKYIRMASRTCRCFSYVRWCVYIEVFLNFFQVITSAHRNYSAVHRAQCTGTFIFDWKLCTWLCLVWSKYSKFRQTLNLIRSWHEAKSYQFQVTANQRNYEIERKWRAKRKEMT